MILAVLFVAGLIAAYFWGYRSGVAYCVREMKPLVAQMQAIRKELQS
jgi:hypothetical protein